MRAEHPILCTGRVALVALVVFWVLAGSTPAWARVPGLKTLSPTPSGR